METKEKLKLGLHENVAKNLIFIDGLTRCGKSMFSGIIPSLTSMEHIQFYNWLEYYVPGRSLGLVDAEFAKNVLRMNMNELVYNLQLGRGVNFRPSDQTGVAKYRDPKLYEDRLNREEGDDIVDELRKGNRGIPFQTHDMLVNLEYLEELDLDYRMLELFRHPVDNIYSWWTRGWGDRFGTDPRAFTLTIEYEGEQLPWYCVGFEKEWLAANPKERCVLTAGSLIRRSVEQYLKSTQKERIHILTFEDFAENPDQELGKICEFLKVETTDDTPRFLQEARCPRELDPADRTRKLEEFQADIRKEYLDLLMGLSSAYEQDLYGLREA